MINILINFYVNVHSFGIVSASRELTAFVPCTLPLWLQLPGPHRDPNTNSSCVFKQLWSFSATP